MSADGRRCKYAIFLIARANVRRHKVRQEAAMSSASLPWLAPSCAADATLTAFAAWLEGAGGWLASSLQISCDSKSSGRGVVVRDGAARQRGAGDGGARAEERARRRAERVPL